MLKVLHITNWYPNKSNELEALFIREHFQSITPFVDRNHLLHIEVSEAKTPWKKSSYSLEPNTRSILLNTILAKSWKIKEWLTYRLIKKHAYSIVRSREVDIVCFHIAYPLCTYIESLIKNIKVPICIVEHWSGYHLNFNLPKGSKSLDPIRNIFAHKIPIITVSQALADDIKDFSEKDFPTTIIPNIVDSELFHFQDWQNHETQVFFTVNLWRGIKSPFTLLKAFETFATKYPAAIFRIGGYGPLLDEMKEFVKSKKLEERIIFIGKMDKEQIAKELNACTAFLQASSYETFSVITAEALMCGTPCIVSDLPAIREYFDADAGLLIAGNDPVEWSNAMESIVNKAYDRQSIARKYSSRFSKHSVGQKFKDTLEDIVEQWNN